MVFQHAELLPWLSALQNVMFGLEMKGMRGAPLRETAEKYLHLVGLKDSQNRRPHQLSGGMKQRVGIARALAIDPKVLLMDEPFGALDAQTRESLQAELLDIHARTGKTVLFVTHDLDEAVLIADRIVVHRPRHAGVCRNALQGLARNTRRRRGALMVDVADTSKTTAAPASDPPERRPFPRWVITLASVAFMLILWEIFGRRINPVFGSYPSAIAVAFWDLAVTGQLWSALYESLRPFLLGYALAIVVGVPLGLLVGGFRAAEAALGIYVTAGYAMPLVALVPLLILWLGLGFAVKVAVVFLMALFPICINTWLGVVAVPKTLIEVGKSFVAPNIVILRRIVLPATLPYIMAGIRLAVGRAVVAMVIAEFFTTISGLGAVIINSANNFDTATMFVPIIILMVMAIGLNWLIGFVERKVAPWQAEIAGRDRE
jgi:NitT/TauT family transport system permease protein